MFIFKIIVGIIFITSILFNLIGGAFFYYFSVKNEKKFQITLKVNGEKIKFIDE
jgi:hypothetical protein